MSTGVDDADRWIRQIIEGRPAAAVTKEILEQVDSQGHEFEVGDVVDVQLSDGSTHRGKVTHISGLGGTARIEGLSMPAPWDKLTLLDKGADQDKLQELVRFLDNYAFHYDEEIPPYPRPQGWWSKYKHTRGRYELAVFARDRWILKELDGAKELSVDKGEGLDKLKRFISQNISP